MLAQPTAVLAPSLLKKRIMENSLCLRISVSASPQVNSITQQQKKRLAVVLAMTHWNPISGVATLCYGSMRTPVFVFDARYVKYVYTVGDRATIVRFYG